MLAGVYVIYDDGRPLVEAYDGPQIVGMDLQRRDLTVELLRTVPGLTVVPPAGAFYCFPHCGELLGRRTAAGTVLRTDEDVVLYLLDTSGVATVHGAAYGLSPHFRISFATSACSRECHHPNRGGRRRSPLIVPSSSRPSSTSPPLPTPAQGTAMTTTAHPANLARAIVGQAAARPDLKLGTTGDQLTLHEALGLAARRAHDLLDSGLQPGQRVALVDSTSTDYLLTWLACVLAGTPVALVNPTYPADLIERMLEPLGPDRILGPDAIAQARTSGKAAPDGLPGPDADPFGVVSYMHTSGTTGLPKFCIQTHDYFLRMAAAMAAALDLTPDDRVLAPLPLFHINPMGYGIVTALLTGADALTVPKFSASRFWPSVVSEQVTVLILHAPPVEILKRATTGTDAAGHRVRTMFYADAEFLRRFAIPAAVSGYGSTEAGGISHLRRWSAADDIPADASRHGGPGRADIEWRVDPDGTVVVRECEHAALFGGYVTAGGHDSARDGDGWFDTGDIGRADGPDYLVFLERCAESIRVKGEFVPIPFVENHLADIPGIADHALWKRRGELVDEEIVLYVVADNLPLDDLRQRIAGLPPFMRPAAVAQVTALPVTPPPARCSAGGSPTSLS
jgi:carnitine-CoA ligase